MATTQIVSLTVGIEPEMIMLEDGLKELDMDQGNKHQFRLFVSPATAIEFFKFPEKTSYKDIPIHLVSTFPSRLCLIVFSTEYGED